MELQLHARRDKAFATHYDRLFAEHRSVMGSLVERLFAQIERVTKINDVTTLTTDVILAAQESLVIGTL